MFRNQSKYKNVELKEMKDSSASFPPSTASSDYLPMKASRELVAFRSGSFASSITIKSLTRNDSRILDTSMKISDIDWGFRVSEGKMEFIH